MKTTALLLATCAACAAAYAAPSMTARFQNGDMIHGSLVDIRDDKLIWKSDSFYEPQSLLLDQALDVTLPPTESRALPKGDHVAIATLTNGDQIRGTLLQVSKKDIVLLTNFAGELIFRRDMVDSLEIEERPNTYYTGPKSIEEWTQSLDGGWSLDQGALVCNEASSIGHEVGKHGLIRIAFDVEWRETPNFRVFTCADSLDFDKITNGFELICRSQYVYMRKRTLIDGRSQNTTLGSQSSIRELQEKEKVRIEILHDTIKGRIRLLMDKRVIADWREPAPSPDVFGGALHFVSETGQPLRISRIQVTSWSGLDDEEWQENDRANFQGFQGRLGLMEEEGEKVEEEQDDVAGIILRNGDRVEGETTGIADGKVTLKTVYKEFQLPVSRLRSFALRSAEEALDYNLRWEPKIRNGDLRATFVEGGHITFQLIDFGDGTIRGRSQTFGEAEFRLSAFDRLEFNLYPVPNLSR